MARISKELGIHVMTLYSWRKAWRLLVEVDPHLEGNQKDEVRQPSSLWYWEP